MSSRIDMEIAIAMRLDNKTYQEIADRFGVSYQCVQQKLRYCTRARKDGDYIERIPYKGLYDFLMEHERVTIPYLAGIMYTDTSRARIERVRHLFEGRSAHITKGALDRLLAYTGMTYEELFELREGFEEDDDVQGTD